MNDKYCLFKKTNCIFPQEFYILLNYLLGISIYLSVFGFSRIKKLTLMVGKATRNYKSF